MLAIRSPNEAYRRIDFDARVEGADPRHLVGLCYEQLISSLGSAIFAQERGDNSLKSQALTRGLSAITALQLGVSGENDTAKALRHLYEAARRAILDSAIEFDGTILGTIRNDFIEISRAMNISAQ
ncbi:flagellar protein FliS [Novosphingobium sp. G106]|uniref:flagellar export chaperone FliS n=1 Tax=Novosphingobium sp. G106 TaxID=2849500 RepID=UPI001C2CED8A|nr:flagellar protein FliS [Novosphingobium sp. G106]MBV1690674.1 flagellar protein FliS [Novosphingobium sp. G106]